MDGSALASLTKVLLVHRLWRRRRNGLALPGAVALAPVWCVALAPLGAVAEAMPGELALAQCGAFGRGACGALVAVPPWCGGCGVAW